jgi:CBS domain-containing protein
MLMTTTPGKSGGQFEATSFSNIRNFKKSFPKHEIEVDGGVNAEVSFILRNMNVNRAVSGSYLMNADDFAQALMHLKYTATHSHFIVADVMLPLEATPFIYDNSNVIQALQTIENHRLGFVAVVDDNNQLKGIISNADVRRAWLKQLQDPSGFASDLIKIMNHSPITIKTNNTVAEMLEVVKQLAYPILFLPVIDVTDKLCGTISFNDLIKGEG